MRAKPERRFFAILTRLAEEPAALLLSPSPS
jgi:hypothetical protein